MVFETHKAARIAKSKFLQDDRKGFIDQLRREIQATCRKAVREGLQPAIRLNGSSDTGWENLAPGLFAQFPDVHFYDYTKRRPRMVESLTRKDWPTNYRLTFSRSGENDSEVEEILSMGGNVAVVFATDVFPETYLGYPVVSGEVSDYRYGDPRNVVIGLKARGAARHDTSGFVVRV